MTATSTSVPRREHSLVVILVTLWHLLLSLALLGFAAWLALGRVEALQGAVAWIVAGLTAVLAVVQLAFVPRLWQRQSSGRIMSLVVNFVGFLTTAFLVFRNLTYFAPDLSFDQRLADTTPLLVLLALFGAFSWLMWNRSTAQVYHETIAQREALTGYLYISPYLLLTAIFTAGLIAYAVWLSFHKSAIFDTPVYVGLDNYAEAFKADLFQRALYNVFWYVIFVVVLQTSIALFLAVLLNAAIRGRGFFRTMFYAPSVTAPIVISLIFLWLYAKRGFFNFIFTQVGLDNLFEAIGIKAQPNWLNTTTGLIQIIVTPFVQDPKALEWWLRGPSVAWMAIMAMNIFTTAPTFMIIFLAALQDIPDHLYEAASIDGASGWRQFWNVTLPLLRPVILLVVVLGTIGTFQVFDQAYVMTQGGPLDTTLTPVLLIYQKALGEQTIARAGYASAMAFLLGAIIFVFTFVQRRFIERGTEQY